jgi:hypothetical protein
MDISRLPELNQNYSRQQFKKIRKALFSEANGIREQGKSRVNHRSVARIQKETGPRHLFVDEEDEEARKADEEMELEMMKKKAGKKGGEIEMP